MSKTKRRHQTLIRQNETIPVSPKLFKMAVRTEANQQALHLFRQVADETENELFRKLMVLPTIVLMDNFGKLMKREGRIQTFLDLVFEQFQYIENGEVKLDELIKQIEDELGHEVEFAYKRVDEQ